MRERFDMTWAQARRAIEEGKVSVDGEIVLVPTHRVAEGAHVSVDVNAPRPQTRARAERAKGLVVHVDASVVVVNKPAAMSTVPFGDEPQAARIATLDAVVRDVLSSAGGRGRAPLGVVQRLDRGTTGLLVFARTVSAKRHLEGQLRRHAVERRYLAIAHGTVAKTTFRTHLVQNRGDGLRGSSRDGRGQLAITHVEPVEALRGATLVRCQLETGRTHQIRIHLAEAGHPLVGERVYIRHFEGPTIEAPRPMLHATHLGFVHPATEAWMRFSLPPPDDFEAMLTALRRNDGAPMKGRR